MEAASLPTSQYHLVLALASLDLCFSTFNVHGLRKCYNALLYLALSLSYLALLDIVVGDDGVLVPDGVELVHEDVLEVAQLHVDAVEPLPPPRHRPQARLVPGNVTQVQRVQHLQSRETITEGYF